MSASSVDLIEEIPQRALLARGRVSWTFFASCSRASISIASAPAVHRDEVHLTVAVVRYTTNKRPRIGVASTYLADRTPLHEPAVPVFIPIRTSRLPEDPARDIIMVSPGTGLSRPSARLCTSASRTTRPGGCGVFFGEQRRAFDLFIRGGMGSVARAG